MVFSNHISFPLAAAAKAANEVPLISIAKLLPSSADTCSSMPTACHIQRLSAGQKWLQGGRKEGWGGHHASWELFSLSWEPQQAHKTFAQVN